MPKSSDLNSLIEKEKLDLQQRKSHGEETGASLCELILFKNHPPAYLFQNATLLMLLLLVANQRMGVCGL